MGLSRNYYGIEKAMLEQSKNDGDKCVLRWLERAQAMKNRRQYFEEMWKRSIFAFIAHAVYGGDAKRSFDPDTAPELQGYFSSKVNSMGFRFTDVRYPLEFAVIMRKLAMEIKNIPPVEWMLPEEDDQSPAILFENVYNQIMTEEAKEDFENFELWLGKNVFGTSVAWSRMIEYKKKLRTFKGMKVLEDGTQEPEYETSDVVVKKFKYSNWDLRHILIDEGCTSPSLDDCEDGIAFEYYSENKANEVFGKDVLDKLGAKACLRSEAFQDINDRNGGDQKKVYEVMHCYNEVTDEYTVIISGKWYKTTPIPTLDDCGEKKIPFTFFVDHVVPGQPYGVGEPAIIKAFREIKNKNRNLIYDVTKKTAKPTLIIDPLSAFDEEKYVFGQDFIRAAPTDVSPLNITPNLQPALDLDKITDQDIIITTGVDILNTAAAQGQETATKTLERKDSQVAIVDLGMRFNVSCGLTRLHSINANIILLHLQKPDFKEDGTKEEEKTRDIMLKNKKLFRGKFADSPKFAQEDGQGYQHFTYKGSDLKYRFKPTLKYGSIALSKHLQEQLDLEGISTMAKITPNVMDEFTAGSIIQKMYNFPKELVKSQQPVVDPNNPNAAAMTETDTINQLLQQKGALLPQNVLQGNQFKNDQMAQMAQQMAGSTQGAQAAPPAAAPVGAGG